MTNLKPILFNRYTKAINQLDTLRVSGRVVHVIGLTIEAIGLDCQIGEVCDILTGSDVIKAEVVGFRNRSTILMPLGEMEGIQPDARVYPLGSVFRAPVGKQLMGRVLDGLGEPIDGKGPLEDLHLTKPINNLAPDPLSRKTISNPLVTGVRAIDALLTCGKGQRMGIFAGSGVGKSTLMGSIARSLSSDVSVIALIGERGREVREFVENSLGPEGLERSIVVVSTSDKPALLRMKAAWVAITIAEYFRDQGLDVTFLMDSVTRFAMAQREIGLAIGEPPASKGYTPSVFAKLPQLMERAGTGEEGSITAFFTVLVEGDDFNEPISDAARGILDGHIILSRDLASRNHYPAIDVLDSVSRVMPSITTSEHRMKAGIIRKHLATYEKARDLINIGAYVEGSDPDIDAAIAAMPSINDLLLQGPEFCPFDQTIQLVSEVGSKGK